MGYSFKWRKRWAGPDGVLTGFISPEGVFSTDDGSQPTGTVHLPGLTVKRWYRP